MTERRRTTAALVVVVAAVGLALLAFAPAAVADPHEDGTSAYAITQGEQCIDATPIVDESQSVESFYDYRSNETDPNGDYSSYGTTDYQEDNTSTLFVYEGSDGTSLVVVHGKHYPDSDDSPNGSFATFELSGLPTGNWAIQDDDYSSQDDEFTHDGNESTMVWGWGQGRTDGGAYRGLGDDVAIGIDPSFNDPSDHPVNVENSPSYDGVVHDWDVVSATESGVDRVRLQNLSDTVTIESGYCTPPNAGLAVSNRTPKAGQSVTLDASNATSGATVTEYRWDTDGDETAEATTREPVLEHTFQSDGERDVTVTVDDGYDSDTASVAVDVTDETPPVASIDAPATVAAGEVLTASATNSSDDHRIGRYDWTFEDGPTITDGNQTASHTYEEPGTYEIELTVADPSENEHVTTTNVTVTEAPDPPESDGPVANLSAPANVDVNESVTLDATDATASANASYEWLVDGDPVSDASGATHPVTFDHAGTYTVEVVVSDHGHSDSATVTIDVENESDGGAGDGDDEDGSGSGDGDTDGDDSKSDGGDGGSSGPDGNGDHESSTETTVAVENGTVIVTATHVDAGESFTAEVPPNASDGSIVQLRSVAVTADADAHELTIAFEPATGSVPGRFTTSSAYVPNATAAVETVQYEFAVDRDVLESAGITAETLAVYGDVGGGHDRWTATATEAVVDDKGDKHGGEATGDRILASATVRGNATVGVGAEGPALFVRGVETIGTMANGSIDVATTVRNTGDEPGEWTLPIEAVGGHAVERRVALDAGEATTVDATISLAGASETTVLAGGVRRSVAAVVVEPLQIGTTDPATNESIVVEAVVENRGTAAASFDAQLANGDRAVGSKRVELAPGERKTVTFEPRFADPGSHELAVGNATATVRVSDRSSFEETESDDGSDATSGFGVLVALVAATLAIFGRRGRSGE